MGRTILSSTAIFLVIICLYFDASPVQGEITEPCPAGMLIGDARDMKPCSYCVCKEEGLHCAKCPVKDLDNPYPESCRSQPTEGKFPICCEEKLICDFPEKK